MLATLVGLGAPSWSQTIHEVPGDFGTIQGAISAAVDGDTVLIAPGTYFEDIDFLGKAIVVQSTDPLDPSIVASTIIDGSACSGYSCSVVKFWTNEGPDSILDGLTITRGRGTYFGPGPNAILQGGGIFCLEASPTIMNCTVSGNTLTPLPGYGAFFGGVAVLSASPTLSGCNISDNTVPSGGSGGGVGVCNVGYPGYSSSSLTLTDCVISDNIAGNSGGGVFGCGDLTMTNCVVGYNAADSYGGGIAVNGGVVTVSDSTINGNEADSGGGIYSGIYDATDGDLTIIGSVVRDNTATAFGGGVRSLFATLVNSTISGNTALVGGGVYAYHCGPRLINCTVVGNTATGLSGHYGGGMSFYHGQFPCFPGHPEPSVTNSAVWGNSPDQILGFGVSHSSVQDGFTGTGNIDLDPLFVDPDNGNFLLGPDSPCINLGTNDPPGGLPMEDANGNPRVICGIVDMGAFEAPEPLDGCTPLFIRGDCDFDLSVNPIVDALFLFNFGFQGGQAPLCLDACDADDDGVSNALVDGLYILSFGFTMGPAPAAPHPLCGSDPTPDSVSCDDFTGCP